MQIADAHAEQPVTANRMSRRRFLTRAALCAAIPVTLGTYITQVEPFWLDVHEMPLTVAALPKQFDGFRVVHLTDLHAGEKVGMPYLRKVVDRILALKPDVVAVTGDLVNHTDTTIEPVSELLGTIPVPVLVCFGNHDYMFHTARPGNFSVIADPLEAALEQRGCIVLRNRAVPIDRDGARLWFVGMEDLYTTRFNPRVAFNGLRFEDPVIALAHNPDSSTWLQNWGAKLVLSGHTHGGQIRIPFLGAPVLPLLNRRFGQGLFALKNGCQMYVSRGVGYLYQARLCCRPELPCIVLRSKHSA